MLKFSHGALRYMKSKVSPKYFVHDSSSNGYNR